MNEIDLTLALQLQAQFEEELRVSLLKQQEEEQKHRNEGTPILLELHKKKNSGQPLEEPQQERLPLSLVDPSWELVDPNPDIHILFLAFNSQFFWGRLAGVEVRWSPRMTLCAGVCSYEGRGGLCSVRLSLPLLKLRPRKDLVETLLHEMIHAYLFVTANNRDRDGHGPEFHKHMYRINNMAGTNITVFHTFHDEVDVYRQHIWQCDGPCRARKPYFGLLKRSMNRAPGPRDHWWERHRQTCGGTYRKIQEPECAGAAKKGSGAASKKADGCSDIRKFISFTGKSNSFGEASSKPSRDSKDGQNDSSKENTPERSLEMKGESKGQQNLSKTRENQNNVQGFSGSSSGKVSQIRVAGASHSNVHGFGNHPGSHSPARKKPCGGNEKTFGGRSTATKHFGGSGTTGLAVRGGGSRTVTVKGKTGARTKTHTRDSDQGETNAASRVSFRGQGYTLGGGEGKVSKLLSMSASQVPSRSPCPSTSWQSNTSNTQDSDVEMCSDEDEKGSASCPTVLLAQSDAPQKIQKSLDCYVVTGTPSPPAGKTVRCPVCDAVVPEGEINAHLDECASNLSDEDVKEDETRGSLRSRTPFVGHQEEVDAGGTSNEDTGGSRKLSGASSPDECLEGGLAELYPCPVCGENCSPATINQHLDSHF